MKVSESTVRLLLGGIVVLGIAGAVAKNAGITNWLPREKISATSTTQAPEITPSPTPKQSGEYVVERGDSLWKISVKAYGTGFNWTDIYRANGQRIGPNANQLAIGIKLELPKTPAKLAPDIVQVEEHRVQAGDSLWKVAVQVCGDGYAWVKIAETNKLVQPNLIYPGQKFKIECR